MTTMTVYDHRADPLRPHIERGIAESPALRAAMGNVAPDYQKNIASDVTTDILFEIWKAPVKDRAAVNIPAVRPDNLLANEEASFDNAKARLERWIKGEGQYNGVFAIQIDIERVLRYDCNT